MQASIRDSQLMNEASNFMVYVQYIDTLVSLHSNLSIYIVYQFAKSLNNQFDAKHANFREKDTH